MSEKKLKAGRGLNLNTAYNTAKDIPGFWKTVNITIGLKEISHHDEDDPMKPRVRIGYICHKCAVVTEYPERHKCGVG